jgi:hypothetical protein
MGTYARVALRGVAALYLVGLFLDGVGCDVPPRVLPPAADYFLQVAALFPDAATAATDYRAEGWVCAEKRWREIRTAAYFPLDPDDKENRFQRAFHFYRDEPSVLHALDTYLVESHDARWGDDGIPRDEAIGGVRFVVVRTPIPAPGAPLTRFSRRPLMEVPDAEKHVVYRTPKSDLARRCPGEPPPGAAP